MQKILQINAGSKIFGGVESFIFNYYKNIEKKEFNFDFLTLGYSTYTHQAEYMKENGSELFELGVDVTRISGKILLVIRLFRFLKTHHYTIIHIHTGGKITQIICLAIAKILGVTHRIAHSHTFLEKEFCGRLKSKIICKLATNYLACSSASADYMFGSDNADKVLVMHNAIELDKFVFNHELRKQYKERFGIKNEYIIGNVARFQKVKNHKYMIDIITYLKDINVKLFLVGDGELKEEIKRYAEERGVINQVQFLGQRQDVNCLYQIFDVFILPSLHEGFPFTLVEAQASGLDIVVTKGITEEVKIIDNVYFLPINDDGKLWADKIKMLIHSKEKRKSEYKKVSSYGYDIKHETNKLLSLYKGITGNS